MKCPCCKIEQEMELKFKPITLTTDWGYEYFLECLNCGILFREVATAYDNQPKRIKTD